MSSAPGNIFLTTENLAFSLPLIFVCGTYAYFKYVPLYIGLPLLGFLGLVYQINTQLKAQRDNKLQNMDKKAMDALAMELVGGDDAEDAKKEEEAKKLAKKKAAIQRRLEVEARKEAKKSKSKSKKKTNDDDDDVALDTFAKGSRNGKKKN